MTKDEYLSNEKFPRLLSLEEVNDPYLVITEFFKSNSLQDCREGLKAWFHAALADETMSETGKSSNLFSFYERLEKLIEANDLINEKELKALYK